MDNNNNKFTKVIKIEEPHTVTFDSGEPNVISVGGENFSKLTSSFISDGVVYRIPPMKKQTKVEEQHTETMQDNGIYTDLKEEDRERHR